MKFRIWLFLFLFLLFFPLFSSAIFGQVVINEFSSGTTSDWVEIYNAGDPKDISNLKVVDNDDNQKEFPNCLLSGHQTYVVDWSNRLNNSGDKISLKENGAVIDCVSYGGGPACEGQGINLPVLEATEFGARQPEGIGNWVKTTTSTKSDNSFCISPSLTPTPSLAPNPTNTPTPTPASTGTPTNTPTSTSTPASYSNIYISEFLANPESGNEKVEIKNGNSFEVGLTDWQIDDVSGEGKDPKKFSATIPVNGLFTVDLNTTSFLDNDGDDVRLLDFSGVEKDKRTYSSTTKGKSWSKDNDGNWCETESSFGQSNPDCPFSTSSPTSTPTLTPTPTSKPNTPTPSKKLTLTATPTEKVATESGEILGKEATESGLYLLGESTPSATPTPEEEKIRKPKDFLPIVLIGLGIILVGVAFLPFLPKERLKGVREKIGGIMSQKASNSKF